MHAGSVVAALASWLDARAHQGRWLVRIEDIDPPRCQPDAGPHILQQLAALGLHADAPIVWQSQRHSLYEQALAQLLQQHWAYPCACTRKSIQQTWAAMGLRPERHQQLPYPGTCRQGLPEGMAARSWRFQLEQFVQAQSTPPQPNPLGYALNPDGLLRWYDRRLAWQEQYPTQTVGDFVLLRADGLWSYQLAVVVDDAAQGITHVVRGEDLCDNTPRQLLLQSALGLPHPQYLHTPLVRLPSGEKLSKQHGAPAVLTDQPLACLQTAAQTLGMPCAPEGSLLGDALGFWTQAWRMLYLQ